MVVQMDANSPNSPRMISAAKKRQTALQLKEKGASIEMIANQLGVSTRMIYKYLKTALDDVREKTTLSAENMVALSDLRINSVILNVETKAGKGDVKSNRVILKADAELRKLHGLDKPIKIAPTNPEGDEEYSPEGIRQRLNDLINKKDE